MWNKIDLVNKEIRKELKDGIPQISCKTGDGMRDLMEIVDQKLKVVGNQKKYEVEYGVELHGEIVQWLKENTNTPYELDTEYDYESTEEYPNGKVKLKIDLD